MSILSPVAVPMQFRGPGRTLDPSTEQPMPDYSGEPVLSPVGIADELSAAGQRDGWAERFAQAHAEADADEARNLLASTELSPAEFKALIEGECGPERRWKVEAWAYVYSNHYGPRADQSKYHATMYASMDDKRGVPLKADSLRDLARLMIELDAHMSSMAVVNLVPVVELAGA